MQCIFILISTKGFCLSWELSVFLYRWLLRAVNVGIGTNIREHNVAFSAKICPYALSQQDNKNFWFKIEAILYPMEIHNEMKGKHQCESKKDYCL